MNLLLDTHVALWAITDSPKLSPKARELILSPRTSVWVSVASVWEIAIKHTLGRGDLDARLQRAYSTTARASCSPTRTGSPPQMTKKRSHPAALLLAILTLAVLAATAHWIVFGPGVRECTTPFLSSFIRDYVSIDMECRIIFGMGALATTGVLLMAVAEAARDWCGLADVGRWLHKVGVTMLAVGLFPLFALVLLLLLGSIFSQFVRDKISGKCGD